ncbi:hypothetical protein [Hyphomicrobium sp. LHD-15]|uniref:hypothetical protein n=1 Tax=Hyphomicrobium sp. LHD-15 TaxID=3072142 RepID=UPI00280D6F11|nr:hypothetical protein [Hyphomicrobium sp. LHD-15]MDQ8697434.1 hypothetical protein [Hyphomicrobium sp. LHD-15]
MKNSAALFKTASTVTYLPTKVRSASQSEHSPIRYPWTEELERRRKAVARWRGNETGLKESMMRGPSA